MQTLKSGLLYFALAFGAGFVLGTIRVLWAVPLFGERTAELVEAPVMLVVTILAARWVVHHMAAPRTPTRRFAVGVVALGLLLMAEFAVVLMLRGLTIPEYFASRDAVAAMVYILMLIVFAVMPLLVARA